MTAPTGEPPEAQTSIRIVRPASNEELVWQDWDDGCTIYNRATGETHFLDLWTSYLLRLIEAESRSQEDLAAAMADDLVQDRDAAFDQKLTSTLDNFESMALVERCPAD